MAAINLKKIFNKEFNESLVHQVATDYMSNQRSGTKAQKIDLLLVEVEQNQDHKKDLEEQELELPEDLYGEVVELLLLPHQSNIIKKLIKKCIRML